MNTTKRIFISCLIATSISCFSQEPNKEIEKTKTKMDAFISKTGTIIKFTDTKLSVIKGTYGGAESRVRKINSNTQTIYFYQIDKSGKYGNTVASIEYNDLVEVIKAIKLLKNDVEKDISENPDYLENKFTTIDGFQVGYYINKGKATWYIKLEKFGSDNTLFIESGDYLETIFVEGKNKIDELKK